MAFPGYRTPDRTGLVALAAYGLIYALYVWKYSLANRPFPEATLLAYGVSVPLVLAVVMSKTAERWDLLRSPLTYTCFIASLMAVFWVLMVQFDPTGFGIGRYPALVEWVEMLLDGEYPYRAGSNPSGFPILFLLATPLQIVGEVGLFQICGLGLFGWIVYARYADRPFESFRLITLLVVSPIFAYEVCVRSELIANGVIILAACEVARRYAGPGLRQLPLWLGFVIGLAACTRGISLVIYSVVLPVLLKGRTVRSKATLLTGALIGFLAPILPFALWDWQDFWALGPLSVQLEHIPTWLLALAMTGALIAGRKAGSFRTAYFWTGLILFGVVFTKMVISMASHGISETIRCDLYFDPAYFGFALPFLLMAILEPTQDRATQTLPSPTAPRL